MTKFHLLLSLLFVFVALNGIAQPVHPEDGEVYRDDVVPRVDIFIHPDTLQWIYDNPESNIEWRATFVFDNGFVNDTVDEIGFRIRGNTSRWSDKKSFKVSFNTYHTGRRYYGVKKLNLNGEHNDPSVARAKLCWDLGRDFGLPVPRSNHVQVYINNNYHGLYINVEHINNDFVESRFGNQYGNLYKCLWPAGLDYLGSNPDVYKFEHSGRRAYELKTHEVYDDYSDLAHFIDVLNNTPTDDLPCALEQIFNVQDYLKTIAFDVATGNWDGYIFNKNNFYLYHNPVTGKFEYILYDLDNTFGIDWFGVDWRYRNIYQWSPSDHQNEQRPLYNRLMDVQKYRDWYSFYLNQLINELLVQPDYFEYMDAIRNKIYPFIVNDPYYPLEYGFSPDDFLQSYETGWGGHVPYGLKQYLTTRVGSIQDQLDLNPISPAISYFHLHHKGISQPTDVSVFVTDDQPGLSAWLYYKIDQSGFLNIPMTAGSSGFYHASLPALNQEGIVQYFVEAQDASGNSTIYPCEPDELYVAPAYTSGLFINEFMAFNQTTVFDSEGDYEDWIELFNGGDDPIWLGDKFLTDKPDNPDRWQMPDYTIMPGEFLLIWADNDPEQGIFHTGFGLSKDGEGVGIFNNEASGFAPIDTYTFGPQQSDVSLGRSPDGSENWVFFDEPTPGSTNGINVVVDSLVAGKELVLFPNPVSGAWLSFSRKISFDIYNLAGVKMLEGKQVDKIDIRSLDRGIYILKTVDNESIKFIVF